MDKYNGSYKSALVRARRVLGKAGFPLSRTTGRYTPYNNEQVTTDGVSVTRLGLSSTITLHVTTWASRHIETAAQREERKLVLALAIQTLREAGLAFDERGWLDCKS